MAKKVFAVYLAKEDVPNSEAYATLELPASPWELWDAMEKVRLKDGEALYMEIDDYYAFEYLAPHLEELDISLNELNDLAARLATLDEVQGIAFEGLFSVEVQKKVNTNGGVITLQDLRNLAVSAKTDCYHVVDAADDAALGRLYAENDFIPELDGVSDAVFMLYGRISESSFALTIIKHRQCEYLCRSKRSSRLCATWSSGKRSDSRRCTSPSRMMPCRMSQSRKNRLCLQIQVRNG